MMMMHPNPHLLLMSRLGFTVVDLAANRLGELSQSQQESIQERTGRQVRVGLLILAAVVLLEVIVLREWIIPAFTLALGVTLLVTLRLRGLDDLRGGVAMLTGALEQITPAAPSGFTLTIGGMRFPASQQTAHAFAVGHFYRVYYTRVSRALLSAEVLG